LTFSHEKSFSIAGNAKETFCAHAMIFPRFYFAIEQMRVVYLGWQAVQLALHLNNIFLIFILLIKFFFTFFQMNLRSTRA
jgi:hypothetical protein